MKETILALAVAGALMLAGCGGGSKTATMSGGPSVGGGGGGTPTPTPTPTPGDGSGGGTTAGTTWEQLPGLVDSMNRRSLNRSTDYPRTFCSDLTDCQTIVKSLLATATEPTGTMRRFRGTRTVQTTGSDTATETYYGGWLDNSIFIMESIPRPEPTETGSTRWVHWFSMGIRDRNPVAGVYRGDAVDHDGNWGTSELNYVGSATGGNLGLTINIPAHGARAVMRWSNIPVDNGGSFDNGISFSDNVVGPNRVNGRFYQGGEIGGTFLYRWTLDIPDTIIGAFGAERTP